MNEEAKTETQEAAPPPPRRVLIVVERTHGDAVGLMYEEAEGSEVYQEVIKAMASKDTPALLFPPDLQGRSLAVPFGVVVGVQIAEARLVE
jgi:hypothetical protein